MTLSNTETRYGTIAKVLHWLTALLILALIPSGIIANGMAFDTAEALAEKARLFSIHKTLGVTLFAVAVLRILWALSQQKPLALHPERRAESLLAETVHWLLYGSLVLVPLSGWVHHAATEGFAPILWPLGQDLPFVPKSDTVAGVSAGLHIVFERVLVFSLLLHIAGALKHHFIDRDVTLARMWFGGAEGAGGAHRGTPLAPITAALAAWALAIGVGASLGLFAKHETLPVAATLDAVASDWQVETGTLAIDVTQFGAVVGGSFADWTAAISFDEAAEGVLGSADVTISIGSLTLGSVTAQALGPDYFFAESFPTARFSAEILRAGEAYEARGTLTIRDKTVPVVLPFELTLEGDRAEMTGGLTLDRRDFGVGAAMTDESSLKFEVGVRVDLVATRGGA